MNRRAAQRNWLSRSAPAAALRYFASWQCAHAKRQLAPSLAAGRRPFSNRTFSNRTFSNRTFSNCLAQLLRRHPPSLAHALRRFQRASRHA